MYLICEKYKKNSYRISRNFLIFLMQKNYFFDFVLDDFLAVEDFFAEEAFFVQEREDLQLLSCSNAIF